MVGQSMIRLQVLKGLVVVAANKCFGELRKYIEENKDVLTDQINKNKKYKK